MEKNLDKIERAKKIIEIHTQITENQKRLIEFENSEVRLHFHNEDNYDGFFCQISKRFQTEIKEKFLLGLKDEILDLQEELKKY